MLLHLYFFHDSQSSQLYDYVLVADIIKETTDQTFMKQDAYIRNLKQKNIKVTVRFVTFTILAFQLNFTVSHKALLTVKQIIEHMGKAFYGICAPEEIFAKYKYLLKVSDACNWSGEQICVSYSTRYCILHTAYKPLFKCFKTGSFIHPKPL